MRWLLFLSRLAFICGLFFILTFLLLTRHWVNDPTLESTVITIGYVMGMIVLPVTNLCYLVVRVVKKKITPFVPAWLILFNLLFLLFLIYFIFYLNDPFYHQR